MTVDSRGVSKKKLQKINAELKFTNSVLRLWSRKQRFDDPEYMFHKIGEWPEKYIIKYSPPKKIFKINKQVSMKDYSMPKSRPQRHISLMLEKIKKVDANPWIFQPTLNSVLYPLSKI